MINEKSGTCDISKIELDNLDTAQNGNLIVIKDPQSFFQLDSSYVFSAFVYMKKLKI